MDWSSSPVRQVPLRGVHGLWELRKLDFSLPREHQSVGSHKKVEKPHPQQFSAPSYLVQIQVTRLFYF